MLANNVWAFRLPPAVAVAAGPLCQLFRVVVVEGVVGAVVLLDDDDAGFSRFMCWTLRATW
jgi:hypothetical protein